MMRTALLVALLLVAGPVAAQAQDYTIQFRTDAEQDGPFPQWVAVHKLTVSHDASADTIVPFATGSDVIPGDIQCDCPIDMRPMPPRGEPVAIIPAGVESGEYAVNGTFFVHGGAVPTLTWPGTNVSETMLQVFVPEGLELWAHIDAMEVIALVDGSTLVEFSGAQLMDAGQFSISAEGLIPVGRELEPTINNPTPEPATGINWIHVLIALAIGMVLWAALVGAGLVQKRSRKQVAGEAAHKVEAQAGKTVLEARKRALMAGLKDLEKAKMQGEIEGSAYDAVKADLKKQTVTVMRALEEAE